jgi:hypothetical protein
MHPTGIRHDGEVVDDRFELFHPHIAVAFQLLTFWTCSWQLLALGTFMQVYSPDSIDDARTVQAEVSQVLDALDKDLPVGFF